MPFSQICLLISMLVFTGFSCGNNSNEIRLDVTDGDAVLIAHIKEPTLTLVDLDTNSIVFEEEMPFIISDMVYLDHMDTVIIAGQGESEIMYYNKVNRSFETLTDLREGINDLHYIPETMELYATNPLHNEIYRIIYCEDGTDRMQIDTFKTGEHPSSIAYDPGRDRLYVSNVYDHIIQVFDRHTLELIDAFHVLDRPNGLRIQGDSLYIGGHGTGGELNRDVHIVSLENHRLTNTVETGLMPVVIDYIDKQDDIIAINHGSHSIAAIDKETETVVHSKEVSFNPYFGLRYYDEYLVTTLDGHELIRLDSKTLETIHTIPVKPGPHSMIVLEGTDND
ncbi:YncE family protein [Salisediminibacterium selenitireducens]|uniref:40-residue YVTN family beta-propeller repeat protein n=1 Tax=Bacillus selenitireducens (strain ATCC 700615 / DSM 15326 / MLS10) TaxID=439292 RepID=D6Y151_BACIE|nr:hypothetical protein [Salisediminibacterium selenitireducens]ADH98655.1 hypothetical protein Bsel_1138 [[Bacillus] selenitireducens MLS10]